MVNGVPVRVLLIPVSYAYLLHFGAVSLAKLTLLNIIIIKKRSKDHYHEPQ